MTIFQRYQEGELDLVQTPFVRSLFAAYEDADEIDKETLNKAFPEYFVAKSEGELVEG